MSADGRRAELVEALRPKLGLRQHMAEPLADALLPLVQKIEAGLNAKDARIAELEAELKDASDAYWREREQHEADRLAKDTQLAAQAEAMAELDDKATQAYEDRDEAAHRAEQAEAEIAISEAAIDAWRQRAETAEAARLMQVAAAERWEAEAERAEAERDQLAVTLGRVRALHKPQPAKRVKSCGTHGPATVCSGCDVQEVTVCSHVGCHGWPCDTIAALDQDGGTDADT